jgi:hypothetical protein
VGRFPEREIEEPVELSGRKEKILCGSRPAGLGRGLSVVVSELRNISLLSVEEKQKEFYSHAAEKKKQTNTRSTRGKGNAKKKGQAIT